MEKRILGIHIFDRIKEAGKTQKVLTQYGHIIKTRYGFHELSEETCSRTGILILELAGKSTGDWDQLENELENIGGIKLQKMVFN